MFQMIRFIKSSLPFAKVHTEEKAADAFEYLLVIGVVVVAVIAAVANGFPGGLIADVIAAVKNAILGLPGMGGGA
ncbi:MAG: hypothetical protein Kow0010_00770 [Dehalococcoidia bacterium]